jgi:hypothetical protein
MRRPLCLFASDALGPSLPNRGAPRTCAKGKGVDGTVYALADCRGCELWAARDPLADGDATRNVASAPPLACPHRSNEPVASEQCQTCRGRVEMKVFACSLHATCTLSPVAGHHCCKTCTDRPAA